MKAAAIMPDTAALAGPILTGPVFDHSEQELISKAIAQHRHGAPVNMRSI